MKSTRADERPLIELAPSDHRLAPGLLDAPGGFLWWYVDLIDASGSGLVLIWSYGLPFLPGYARAARAGRPQLPRRRPSLNLALYDEGRLDFYVLQEYPPDGVSWDDSAGVWHFGDNRLVSRCEADIRRVTIDLNCPVPGAEARLRGRVTIEGVARAGGGEASQDTECEHDWTPMTGPARGGAELSFGDGTGPDHKRWELRGRAYHDKNGGRRPLHELGIDSWIWGRAPLDGRERIYYLLWPHDGGAPQALGVDVDDAGRTHPFELDVGLSGPRRNAGGLDWFERVELTHAGQPWLVAEHADVVDSGPFYMRYLTRVRAAGQHLRGVGELCRPDRIDLDHHRPLVRMRVHELRGRNSMWLPLFCGPRTGRVRRLIRGWLPG